MADVVAVMPAALAFFAERLGYQDVEGGLAAGRLALVLQDHAPPPVPVSLVRPASRLRSANINVITEAVAQALRGRRLLPP